MQPLAKGQKFRGKTIYDLVTLSNGWVVLKTEDSKPEGHGADFRVRTVYRLRPTTRSYTPKHAHFAIDFYGKLCCDKEKAQNVFRAIMDVWGRKNTVPDVLGHYSTKVVGLTGYDLEYVLHALNWILEQEDVNFSGRPPERQTELDQNLTQAGVKVLPERLGSELAVSLFCNIMNGQHPVEAFMKANLDVLPVKRARGAR
jgi:hypothetical protein